MKLLWLVIFFFFFSNILCKKFIVHPSNFVEDNQKAIAGDELYFLPGTYENKEAFPIQDNVTYTTSSAEILSFNFVGDVNSTIITGFKFVNASIQINTQINASVPLAPTNIKIYNNNFESGMIYINANGATIQDNIFTQIPETQSIFSMQCANCYILHNHFYDVLAEVIEILNIALPGELVIDSNCIYNTTFPNGASIVSTVTVQGYRNDTVIYVTNNVMYDLLKPSIGYIVSVYFGGKAFVENNYLSGASTNGGIMQFVAYPWYANNTAYLTVYNNTAGGDFWPNWIACEGVQHGEIYENAFYEAEKIGNLFCQGGIQIFNNTLDVNITDMPPVPACPSQYTTLIPEIESLI